MHPLGLLGPSARGSRSFGYCTFWVRHNHDEAATAGIITTGCACNWVRAATGCACNLACGLQLGADITRYDTIMDAAATGYDYNRLRLQLGARC